MATVGKSACRIPWDGWRDGTRNELVGIPVRCRTERQRASQRHLYAWIWPTSGLVCVVYTQHALQRGIQAWQTVGYKPVAAHASAAPSTAAVDDTISSGNGATLTRDRAALAGDCRKSGCGACGTARVGPAPVKPPPTPGVSSCHALASTAGGAEAMEVDWRGSSHSVQFFRPAGGSARAWRQIPGDRLHHGAKPPKRLLQMWEEEGGPGSRHAPATLRHFCQLSC